MKSLDEKRNFLGIDLSFPQKPSACLLLGENLNCLFSGFLLSDEQIIELVLSYQPILTAIDAPLKLPRGLCCLEESCDCLQERLRSAEIALAKRGFPCFFTTKKSIIKPLVYRGMALRKRLEMMGYQVIEVYPYATRTILWGKAPPKSRKEGQAFLGKKLSQLLPMEGDKFCHHFIDAALAAYTAYLHLQGKTITLGEQIDGEIVIPACVKIT